MSPELLLPVGNKEMAMAAIHNGADAIYMGVPGFNARGRSVDFDDEALKDIIETCHLYGVKVNLAFNVVVFENELPELIPLVQKIVALKPDAFIVQDLGLLTLIRELAPEQVIHGSTQMTVTNHEAIALLEDLNIKRFVLGRENSLSEISLIAENSKKELEVFVHGALCVSYSGQCFTSESIGGRSANRGQCAQSCRFSYDLIVDGEAKIEAEKKFLVSPQDLCGLAEIPQLIRIGVASFKIEGRLKTPEYVATAARSYRQAIDSVGVGSPLSKSAQANLRKDMSVFYSRGFFPGWLHGVNHQQLVDARFSSHRGFYFAQVVSISENTFTLESQVEQELQLENGDGLLWSFEQNGKNKEAGSHIYSVKDLGRGRQARHRWQVEVSRESDIGEYLLGARVYLNHDRDLKQEVSKSWSDRTSLKRIPVSLKVQLKLDEPLQVTMSDGVNSVSAKSQSSLSLARTQGLSDEFLREELQALSGSVFVAKEIQFERFQDSALFLSHKEIKELRRELQSQLTKIRSQGRATPVVVAKAAASLGSRDRVALSKKPSMNLLLRQKSQVDDLAQAISAGRVDAQKISSVILDYEFGRDLQTSVNAIKALGLRAGVATTRILKPGEYRNLKAIANLNPDVILVRNLGALQYFTKIQKVSAELVGDFSLNVTNHLTAEYLLGKGLQSVCASYDLNASQVNDLLQHSPANQIEITMHQYMPSFHMEHCVFASQLSTGSSWKDCGKPCEKHRVELKDQFGHRHFLKADQECRNTMYNAVPQSALSYLQSWSKLGLGFVRYEALFETGDEMIQKIVTYMQVLAGEKSVDEALQQLKVLESYGLGEGPIGRAQEYQSRKKATVSLSNELQP